MDTNQEQNYSILYQMEIIKIALKDLNNILLKFDRIGYENFSRKFNIRTLDFFKPDESKIEYFLDKPITISDISQEEILFTKKAIKNALNYYIERDRILKVLNPLKRIIKKQEHFLFERMNEILLNLEQLSEALIFAENQPNPEAIKNSLHSVKFNCNRVFGNVLFVRFSSFYGYIHYFKQHYDWSYKFRLLENIYSMSIDKLNQVQNLLEKLNFSF